jgi:hypothetical protein
MALVEKREAKDWISIYFTGNEWKLVNTFEVDTFDAADVIWCKEDTSILVYDSPLEAKVLIYSAMTGECLVKHNFSITNMGGALGLGIKQVSLSLNGFYCVASFFDTKIKLFHGISFKEIANLEH